MSEAKFPKYLFPQFTEEEIEKASKSINSSVNWTEYDKWIKAGKPYQEHDELIIDQKLENESAHKRPASKLICIHSTISFSCIIKSNL